MRVLQIYKDYNPPVVGGIENHLNLLAQGLYKRRIDVDVLVSNTELRLKRDTIDGINVVKVPQLGRLAAAPINPTLLFWLRRLSEDADLLHFHLPNPTAVMAYLFSGLKKHIVVTYHSDIVRQVRLKRIYIPFLHMFLRRAEIILATSPNYIATSKILKRYKRKCIVAPLGIDLAKFSVETFPEVNIIRTKAASGQPILLFIGRFRHYKGLDVLVSSMRQINAQLWLVGSGPMEGEVRAMVEKNGLRNKVKFWGNLSDTELIACLRACDMLVLPSNFRSEAFGIVQLEAMACGKPVICTELKTGTSYVNQHGKTGIVVPPNRPDAIAQAANYLIGNPDTRAQFGAYGKSYVDQHFTCEKMTDKIVSVYQAIQRRPSDFHCHTTAEHRH